MTACGVSYESEQTVAHLTLVIKTADDGQPVIGR